MKSKSKLLLVTGGAGYIGSHVVRQLSEAGHDVVVYDNLSTGFAEALIHGEKLIVADLADKEKLEKVFQERRIDAVLHFAASIIVSESVADPLKYYSNNTANTLKLIRACVRHNVDKFIFSSTAAVYGEPSSGTISEETPTNPSSPYGTSKLMSEWVLRDTAKAHDFRYVALRYFNAAGADPEGRIGERHNPETHLIPLILKAAKGECEAITVYGKNYPTPDGTCMRDYIHVEDLAAAHLLSLNYLLDGGKSDVFNCGYGHGYSVRQVIDVAKKVTGGIFNVRDGERREGDPPILVADSSRIIQRMKWKPSYDNLEQIIKTAWEWERKQ